MKKLLMLNTVVLFTLPLYGAVEKASSAEDHRFPHNVAQGIPMKKGIIEKVLIAGKGLGAGAMSTFFGAYFYQNARFNFIKRSKEIILFEEISALCSAGAALVCAAKLSSYTLRCAKDILVD